MAKARDCGSRHESSILSGHPIFGSSFSGKTRGFESRFGRSIRPLSAIAGSVNGRPERSERSSDCSIQSPATILCLSSKGQGSRLRTGKSGFESSQAHQKFNGPSSKGEGASLRSSRSRFESGRINQSLLRWWQAGMQLIVYQSYAGSNPVRRARLYRLGSGQDGVVGKRIKTSHLQCEDRRF